MGDFKKALIGLSEDGSKEGSNQSSSSALTINPIASLIIHLSKLPLMNSMAGTFFNGLDQFKRMFGTLPLPLIEEKFAEDRSLGKKIGNASEDGGLYYFDEDTDEYIQAQTTRQGNQRREEDLVPPTTCHDSDLDLGNSQVPLPAINTDDLPIALRKAEVEMPKTIEEALLKKEWKIQ
ncbi:hypothetical protein CK203_099218 [Vitis vinifera]|uniref:Uncharacterized protein n=1 Tax=Vitis vinifera TaxID=29760 RepID=A0A438DMP2_VITVI|nr:hypothetical protein CK203_099218 [Vitis vinifera]